MADGQAVGLCPTIQVVGRYELPGTGHVLNHDIGISRQVFPKVARKHAAIGIESSPSGGADDQNDRLPLVEVLRRRRDRGDQCESQSDYKLEQEREYQRHSDLRERTNMLYDTALHEPVTELHCSLTGILSVVSEIYLFTDSPPADQIF
jgi:hypothetical protein